MEIKEQLKKAEELVGQANYLDQQQMFNEAIEKLEDARSIFKDLGMLYRVRVADMDASIGFIMSSQGLHGEAKNRFRDAKTIYEGLETPDPLKTLKLKTRVADLEGKIGNEFQVLGQPKKALGHYKNAKTSFERLNLPHMIAPATVNIGLVLHDLGKPTEAITHFEKAKNLYHYLTMYPDFATTESRLGAVMADLGKPTEALKHYSVAKRLFEREILKMEREAAGTEMNMGIALVGLGQFTEALKHYGNAKNHFQKINELEGVAKVENNIGLISLAQSKPEEAKEHFEVSKNIYGNLKMPHHAASTDVNMAKALALLRKPKEALKKCDDALGIFQDLGLPMGQGKAYRSMGSIKMDLGDLKGSLNDLDRSLKLMELIRMGVKFPELQRSFKEEYLPILDALSSVNLTLFQRDGNSEYLNEALNYMELGKCSTVAEALEAGGGGVPCPEAKRLILEQDRLLDKAQKSFRKRTELRKLRLDEKINPDEFRTSLASLDVEYDAVQKKIEKLRSEVLVKCADFGSTPIPRTYNILKRTLEVFPRSERWAILEFAISSFMDKLLVFFVTQEGSIQSDAHDVDLGELERLARRCRGIIEKVRKRKWMRANEELRDLSEKLYISLIPEEIGKALKSRDVEHLIVVPHKLLHWVPFEALFDGDNYWGLKYAISTDFSLDIARLCVEKRQRRAIKMKERPYFLIVKNPLDDLPGADKEVDTLVGLLKAERIKHEVLPHKKATQPAFIEAINESPFNVLLYAGHAVFMGKHPSLSSLCLHTSGECLACSGKKKKHTPELLAATEFIHEVKFKRTPIVYLSACESGVAEVEPGDEMFGLVRALMYAGATSLVLSKWKVKDDVAPVFAEEFYSQLLGGESVAVALQNARQKVFKLDPDKFTDWTVFSVQGDPFRRLA